MIFRARNVSEFVKTVQAYSHGCCCTPTLSDWLRASVRDEGEIAPLEIIPGRAEPQRGITKGAECKMESLVF